MISLDDKRWHGLEGGYRLKYDASIPLKKLEAKDGDVVRIWSELWENLYHQGDVGLASYAAVPPLVRIAQSQEILDFNPVALIVSIELARGNELNPKLPDWLEEYYHQAIRNMARYVFENLDREWDEHLLKSALSLLAIVKGNRDLGKLIFEVDEGQESYALEKYFSS